jgi:hypothetical protein
MIPLVLSAPDLAALELAEGNNLFRTTFGWRGRNTATVKHKTVTKLKALGLVETEYRFRAGVEACLATPDGRFILAVARRNRSSRPRPVLPQHTEQLPS